MISTAIFTGRVRRDKQTDRLIVGGEDILKILEKLEDEFVEVTIKRRNIRLKDFVRNIVSKIIIKGW